MKKYMLRERDIHMEGDCVGVCWNLNRAKKSLKDASGLEYIAVVPVRTGDPYIDFVSIRGRADDYYEDEDSPVDGGFGVEVAGQIIRELQWAIVYLNSLGDTNE